MVELKNNRFSQIENQVVQVNIDDQSQFNKIVEVLTRIGIPSFKNKTLCQTAHILHKANKYYIVHFKHMFTLDGKHSTITPQDNIRVKIIANLLQQWGLCTIVDHNNVIDDKDRSIIVIPRSELSQWTLVSKYKIGKFHSKGSLNNE